MSRPTPRPCWASPDECSSTGWICSGSKARTRKPRPVPRMCPRHESRRHGVTTHEIFLMGQTCDTMGSAFNYVQERHSLLVVSVQSITGVTGCVGFESVGEGGPWFI